MAGMILSKNQLVALLRERGVKASKSDSNATLIKKANKIGLGAKKAKPQYLGGRPAPAKRRRRAGPSDRTIEGAMARHRSGEITQTQAMKAMDLDPRKQKDRALFERMECGRGGRRSNPGPDPYRKDMLILAPAGISYTGPFGPFGKYDRQDRMRSNPGLPMPGQVVGGVGDYMQMNPGMDGYLLESEIAPYTSGTQNPYGGGLNDYLILGGSPPKTKKNPRRRRR